MRTYWIVETRGGAGNSDCLSQTEHSTRDEAAKIAERVGGTVYVVAEHGNGRCMMRDDE